MRVNVYIRQENEEAWDKIEKKSEWVNARLEVSTAPVKEMLRRNLEKGFCKVHSLPLDDRGRCLQKGCKYA